MDPLYSDRRFYYQPGLNRRHYPYAVPVRQSDPTRQSDRRSEPQRAPKVVRIPIRFVGSDEEQDRSGSALKIQKAFRGYLVRKCVKEIREIESRVDEIEATLRSDGGLETVRDGEKERLRMIEGLMSLLFRLDSVKGLDLGVRAYRKAVTRRVIALQEVIDSISTAATSSGNQLKADAGQQEEIDSIAAAPLSSNQEIADAEDDEIVRVLDDVADSNREGNDAAIDDDRFENSPATDSTETIRGDGEIRDLNTCPSDSGNLDICVQCEGTEEIKADDGVAHAIAETDSNVLEHQKKNDEDYSKSSDRELLGRIMEDNEKTMKMLTQLCEKNESQSKMLNALAHRVELLEKVFVCERLRKMKNSKKKSDSSGAPC